MSIELNILSSLSKRDNYYRFKDLLDKISLTQESKTIIKDLSEYFESGVTGVDWQDFSEWFKVKHPTKKQESIELYESIFSKLESREDSEQPESILKLLITREYAELIGSTALRVAEGEGSNLDEVSELYDKYCKETGNVDSVDDNIVWESVEELAESHISKAGLNWRLEELNLSVGSLSKGDFVVVGALVETGKTTFLCSELSFMASQLPEGKSVIYILNEEQGSKVKFRIVQATLGMSKGDILKNPKRANEEYSKILGDPKRILVYDKPSVHYREVEKLLDKYDPGLIVFDQLWKVKGFSNSNEVNTITQTFAWAREIAKEYAPVIAVHQASGEAINQPFIDMGMLYYSRIGLQAECDAVITIADPKESDPWIRNLNICKNKLGNGPFAEEKHRHSKWSVYIRPELARYESP